MGRLTQNWIDDLSDKEQTALLTALRGPDIGFDKNHPAKYLIYFYRRCVVLDTHDKESINDPYTDSCSPFVKSSIYRPYNMINEFVNRISEMPGHYIAHFVRAASVLSQNHPDEKVVEFWRCFLGMYSEYMKINTINENYYSILDGLWG